VTTGPHYIEVRGFVEEAEGRYVLGLIPGEIGATPDTAEGITTAGEPRTSQIGSDGDVDWFVLETVEGRPYRINVDGVDETPLADPYVTLYDSNGTEIASDDDGGAGLNSYLYYQAAVGGPIFIGVSSFGDTGTGRYMVRVTDTDVPGHIYSDEYLDASTGDSRLSRIEMPGDLDYYRVSLEEGATYVIDVRGAGAHPLADPFLAIVNIETERITSDDDGGNGLDARLRFTAPSSGEFFIQASGLGGSTGDYQVEIVRR
jgi:hypothetical protein